MADRKISQFNQQTAIPSGSYFSFIYNGQNYKVLDTDFYSALGVTGTLEQAGDPLGIPILNKAGTVNQIRNIESGPGVNASLSVEGGIQLSSAVTFDDSGVKLVDDATAEILNYRSLIPGDGIAIGGTDGEITITATEAAVSTKTVLVNQLSDLPTPVDSVITLNADTEYFLLNDVDLASNRLVFSDKTTLRGSDSVNITLTYSGTGVMLTSAVGTNRIKLVTLSCVNGAILDITAPSGAIFRMVDVSYDCDVFGTITGGSFPDGGALRFTNVSGSSATNGLLTVGNFSVLLYDTASSSIDVGTFIDLDAATYNALYLNTIILDMGVGATFLSGLSSSGNLNPGSIGSVNQCRFGNDGVYLDGVDVSDARWVFFENDKIPDTRVDALISIQGNAAETVISSAGVPVKMAGTWVDNGASGFTVDSTGRMTYIGERTARLPIDMTVTLLSATGGDKQLGAYVAINGTQLLETKKVGTASNTKAASVTLIWQHNFQNGDYVEIFLSNESGTDNVIGEGAVGRIN